MSHSENKVNWCLKKAEKEIQQGNDHRGLIRIKPDINLIDAHIKKAEHNLKAIMDFKKIGYSDWSASATFYSIYHCFLAIITKFGYETRNQECTFALIYHLIETGQIDLDIKTIQEIHSLNLDEKHRSPTIIDIRETEQYGIGLSLENQTFDKLLNTAKIIMERTKSILEE